MKELAFITGYLFAGNFAIASQVVQIDNPTAQNGDPYLAVTAGESYSISIEFPKGLTREYYANPRGLQVCKELGFSEFVPMNQPEYQFGNQKEIAIIGPNHKVSFEKPKVLYIPVTDGYQLFTPGFFESISCR